MASRRRVEEPVARTSVHLFKRQLAALDALNRETRVPIAVMIRDAVDLYLRARQRGRA
jgi:hypothetical protein